MILQTDNNVHPGSLHSGFFTCPTNPYTEEPRRWLMLRVVVHKSGDTVVLHCQGRILGGDVTLRRTAESQQDASLLLLDLAQVHGIDAGGLGVLLKLRQWAHTNGIELRLMNVTGIVRQVLEVTHLDRVFEIGGVEDRSRVLGRQAFPMQYVDQPDRNEHPDKSRRAQNT